MHYYQFILYLLFGILPSLLWLWYYLGKDPHPEPKRMILKVFMWGALVTLPVLAIQISLSDLLAQLQGAGTFARLPFFASLIKWFLVIALTEETLKYLVVRAIAFPSKEIDEPMDLMVYMVVTALGFAAVENFLYLFSPIDHLTVAAVVEQTALVSFIRFIGATFLHTLCSALVGYFLIRACLRGKRVLPMAMIGIGAATLLHGLYDFSIIELASPFAIAIPVTVIIFLAMFIAYDFDEVKKVKGLCKL